jgi:hypothetical protein
LPNPPPSQGENRTWEQATLREKDFSPSLLENLSVPVKKAKRKTNATSPGSFNH